MDVFGKLSTYDFGEVHFKLDKSSQLRAIVAIHDSRLGPALGGCRFIEYETPEAALVDALRLAAGKAHKEAGAGARRCAAARARHGLQGRARGPAARRWQERDHPAQAALRSGGAVPCVR